MLQVEEEEFDETREGDGFADTQELEEDHIMAASDFSDAESTQDEEEEEMEEEDEEGESEGTEAEEEEEEDAETDYLDVRSSPPHKKTHTVLIAKTLFFSQLAFSLACYML